MKFTLGKRKQDKMSGAEQKTNLQAASAQQAASAADCAVTKGNAHNNKPGMPRELMGRRSRNSKCFAGESGTITTVFHDKPIHYLDPADSTFKDIDNSLFDTGNGLETRKNSFKTRFNKRAKDGRIFDVQKDDCKVGLISREAAKRGGCNLEQCSCDAGKAKKESRVMLKGVKDNVDIEYIVDSEKVKENIIIKEKSEDYDFNFDLAIENLIVSVSRDGKRLELKKKVTGRVQFYIPSPFMFDADGTYSDSVYYEVVQDDKNKLS